MRWNNSRSIAIAVILIFAGLIFIPSSPKTQHPTWQKGPDKVCCKCAVPQNDPGNNNMIWENLSRQFIS